MNTENPQNYLANVHSEKTTPVVEKKEEYSNGLAEVHANNPTSDKEVRNHYEAEQNSADKDEQLGNVPEELPTHLGGIPLENEEPTQENEPAK